MAARPRLIVPIDVAALVVGAADSPAVARIHDRFDNMPWLEPSPTPGDPPIKHNPGPFIGEAVKPAFFQNDSPPLTGVHLHWALPDALAHGRSGTDGTVAFREAPNRWLVVRMVSAGTVAPAQRSTAWVIESDRLWDTLPPNAIPQQVESRAVPITDVVPDPEAPEFGKPPFRKMGAAFPYDTWSEAPAGAADYATRHTTMGYGNATYAAAYPHCPNVFGLYDALAQVGAATVSYLVAGWYSDSGKDPLAAIDPTVDALEQTYGWTLTSGQPFPAATICCGLLSTIAWDPQAATPYITPRTGDVAVAIGNTTTEALSALVASIPDLAGLDQAETVLNALQLGLLSKLSVAGGLATLHDALHQRMFSAASGGQIFALKPSAEDPLDPRCGPVLNELNGLQQFYDGFSMELESRRGQIFADWYKYITWKNQTDLPEEINDAFDFIAEEASDIARIADGSTGEPATLARIAAARHAKLIELAGLMDVTEVQRVPAVRFWHPSDPALVFYGPDLPGNLLVCRCSTDVVSSVTIDGSSVPASAVMGLVANDNVLYAADLDALVREASFVDVSQADSVAALIPGVADRHSLAERIEAAETAFVAGTTLPAGITFAGTAPSAVGVQRWASPWIPLILQWEVEYVPRLRVAINDPDDPSTDVSYPPDFLTSTYTLDPDDIELTPRAAMPRVWDDPRLYQGMIVLTPHPEIDLKGQVDAYLLNNPTDPHADELKAIGAALKMPLMSQAMGGLHQALVQRLQTLQLPVLDPFSILDTPLHQAFTNTLVHHAVADQNRVGASPGDSYDPIRGGLMRIAKIRIIDAFGQIRELVSPPAIPAQSLRPADYTKPDGVVEWPPRLAQPARLQFRWRTAADDAVEMNDDPAMSPIFGWVLFNHLDKALALYDADGNPRLSFNLKGPLWQGAPGDDRTYGKTDIADAFMPGDNAHLVAFARGLAENPNAWNFLNDFLKGIDAAMAAIEPHAFSQDPALAVLFGRPLALARASLGLELRGLPAYDQSFTAFIRTLHDDRGARSTAGFERVRIPVRLGDLSQVNDGLVGYFIDDGSAGVYRAFYAPASERGDNGVGPPRFDQLTVTADATAPDLFLTLLLDPRAPVNATTGLLPVEQIQIPPSIYSGALARIAVTFLTTPVLTAADQVTLPLPKEKGYTWSWVTDNAATGWNVATDIRGVNTQAAFASPRLRSCEGWLRLSSE